MFASVDDVKQRSAFDEVKALSDTDITSYLNRAARWIYHATEVDYSETTDQNILEDCKTASIHLVDLLWYQDQPGEKEIHISNTQHEQIGSYQYTLMAKATPQSDSTGISELDMILTGLTPTVYGVGFFNVSGPSDLL